MKVYEGWVATVLFCVRITVRRTKVAGIIIAVTPGNFNLHRAPAQRMRVLLPIQKAQQNS
jgi:hypothetical protein